MSRDSQLNPTQEGTKRSKRGFSLVELLVGIAVGSLLIVVVVQLLTDLSLLQQQTATRSTETHKKAALTEHLIHDLYGVPVGQPDFRGERNQFYRTTPSRESDDHYRMDTRIHYVVRETDEGYHLIREWYFAEIHDDFQDQQVLLRTDEPVEFAYLDETDRWESETATMEHIHAIRLTWSDQTITIPVSPETIAGQKQNESS